MVNYKIIDLKQICFFFQAKNIPHDIFHVWAQCKYLLYVSSLASH